MDDLRGLVSNAVRDIQIDFGGGCSESKGYLIAWLIRKFQITASLDIGVYRGRSLVPQAIAHKAFTGGIAYAVDPWLNSEVREADNPSLTDEIDRFVERTNFSAIYEEVCGLIRRLDIGDNCEILRTTSREAITSFENEKVKFGLIHVDGNHDSDHVMEDVSLYLPRLSPRGFLVMDDISWESVKGAYALVSKKLCRVYQRTDAKNDYAVFWDAPSSISSILLRAELMLVGRG